MANVNDVAAAIVEQCGQGITTMRLEKLAYYCQAWHLASTQHPLFSAEIQAFRDGPVVRELFAQHKGRRVVDQWNGNAASLSEAAASTVRAVVAALADFEGDDLSALTHTEQPWLDARGGLAPEAQGNRAIEHASIQRFFVDKFRPERTSSSRFGRTLSRNGRSTIRPISNGWIASRRSARKMI